MSRIRRLTISLLLIFSIVLPGVFLLPADAASDTSPDKVITGIYNDEKTTAGVKNVQALLDGKYAENAGVSSDWFVYSLRRFDSSYDFTKFNDALYSRATSSGFSGNAVTRERVALLFSIMGVHSDYVKKVISEDTGAMGIMSWVFGLHLINNTSGTSADAAVKALLDAQQSDGGWAISKGSSDVDVTAMVLQALAPYNAGNKTVAGAVNKALTFLSGSQKSNGGFASYGAENPESAAQVVVALTSLGINPLSDSRFIKGGKNPYEAMLAYKASKGYSHTAGGDYNLNATAQVLYASVALYVFNQGGGGLYAYSLSPKSLNLQSGSASKSNSGSGQADSASDTDSTATTASTAVADTSDSTDESESSSSKSSQKFTSPTGSGSRENNLTNNFSPTTISPNNKPTNGGNVSPNGGFTNGSRKERESTTTTTKAAKKAATEADTEPIVPTVTPETVTYTLAPALNTVPYYDATEAYTTTGNYQSFETVTFNDEIDDYSTTYYGGETSASEYTDLYESENTGDKTGPRKSTSFIFRIIAICVAWGLAAISAAVITALKKRKPENYVAIAAVAGIITACALLINIQTPGEFYSPTKADGDGTIIVTISIRCDTVKGRGDEEITPKKGVILPKTKVKLYEGATVYDCLIFIARELQIQVDDKSAGAADHSNAYIAGINNLYEFDYGELSGWIYSVNGVQADVGCGQYLLSDGDKIKWEYTCNLGEDLK
ncbi:MAG: DUF4430 domain-containing protein [Clostridia bacterium]|nr:DUF4430 domain-containing protein [Clostridia bacterium]